MGGPPSAHPETIRESQTPAHTVGRVHAAIYLFLLRRTWDRWAQGLVPGAQHIRWVFFQVTVLMRNLSENPVFQSSPADTMLLEKRNFSDNE